MPGRNRNPGSGKPHSGAPASGAGWGGEAKGEGRKGAGPGRPAGVKTGEGKAAQAREALQDAAPAAVQTIIDIAKSATDQRSLAAAIAILNRIGLHEKSGVEVTGADGGPMRIERVIVDPANPDASGVRALAATGPV